MRDNKFMTLRKDLSDEEFEALSLTKKKQYVAELLIRSSHATPVQEPTSPVAIIMAGLPGAGKTEFLDTFSELLAKYKMEPFVRIDLDEIVTIYPGYTPKTDAQFRSQGNLAVAKCVDVAKDARYNMMIDGTFAGSSEVSLRNVQRLLDAGYLVWLYFMHDKVETSWKYTKARETLTSRGIDREGFVRACNNVTSNLNAAMTRFGGSESFKLSIVLQRELRDKRYQLVTDKETIDTILSTGYNIDNIKDS
jgi:predicted ABC-type ATPase